MSVKGQQAAHELCLMPGSFQCIWKILVIGRRKEGRKGRSKELKSQKEHQPLPVGMWPGCGSLGKEYKHISQSEELSPLPQPHQDPATPLLGIEPRGPKICSAKTCAALLSRQKSGNNPRARVQGQMSGEGNQSPCVQWSTRHCEK